MVTERRRSVVYLVDDDDDLRALLDRALEREGYLVLEARDGKEALARMRGCSLPGVAVIDLVMPGMDGWALAEAMSSDPSLQRVPIVVITSRGRGPVKGAARVIAKPCTAEAIIGAIQDVLPMTPAS
jgi:CheY-like chemotaxis protein